MKGLQLPSLGLNLGLNLSNIPVGAAKKENHFAYFCAPYSKVNQEQLEELKSKVEEMFGEGVKIVQISKNPEQYAIIPPEKGQTAIPTLSTIDAAYQDSEHLTALLDQCLTEQQALSRHIEQLNAEHEIQQAEKIQLMIENAKLEERIKFEKEKAASISEWTKNVKEKYDELSSAK